MVSYFSLDVEEHHPKHSQAHDTQEPEQQQQHLQYQHPEPTPVQEVVEQPSYLSAETTDLDIDDGRSEMAPSVDYSVVTDALDEMNQFEAADFFMATTSGNILDFADEITEQEEVEPEAALDRSLMNERVSVASMRQRRSSVIARSRQNHVKQHVSKVVVWGLKMLLQLFAASAVGKNLCIVV